MMTHLQKLPEMCPNNLAALTPEWLSAQFGADIESFDVIKELAAGVLADAAVIKLNYATGAEGPATAVVKYQKPDPARRRNAVDGEFYDKECRFYSQLQPLLEQMEIPLGTPKCYGLGQKDNETFMIVSK